MIVFCDFADRDSKLKFYELLKKLPEKNHKIEIKVDRNIRSNNQNRYYWGVVLRMISDYTGFTLDEAHEEMKNLFLFYFKPNKVSGEEKKFTKSTTELDTYEFEQYLEQVRQFSAIEFDLVIPLPHEILEI